MINMNLRMGKLLYFVSSLILVSLELMADEIDLETKTKIEKPFELRDPFRRQLARKIKEKKNIQRGLIRDGVFTNILGIDGVPLSDIKIVGVLISNNKRVAVAKIIGRPDNILLKEGMLIGKDKAELKAILPGGVVLVEKITNVYGQDEYLETVLPIVKDNS